MPDPTLETGLERGLALVEAGEFFAAHEALEDAWRAAPPEERDFFQGLVHVAVAWYQAERGNRVGCERQLAKAARRLRPYGPAHRGLDVEALVGLVEGARYPDLPRATIRLTRVDRSFQTDERAKPARPEDGSASGA